jgi:short-subunit dehydrogenase
MTEVKPAVVITGASSDTGRTSLCGFSRRDKLSAARRVERTSDIKAAAHG